jgi:glycosyltransferase involved in cell wall biosynthesis
VKLCLPRIDSLAGGTLAFYRNLQAYLVTARIPFTDNIEADYDALIVNSWVTPYSEVLRAKGAHPAIRILHRVNGSALDYGREAIADLCQARVNLLADLTIFQSQYGKYATTQKYRVIQHDGPVIHNPVDVDRFRPDGERIMVPGAIRVCYVTHSTNRRKGAASLYSMARTNPAVDFILVGRCEAPPPLANLHLMGYAELDALPKVLRSCDAFLMLAENEACPNVVLEAMASGLPVLYRDSGGTAELVGECGRAVRPETFREALDWALDHGKALQEAARKRAVGDRRGVSRP